MDPALSKTIQQRSQIIDRLKADLIDRLSLPYEPQDIHEDIALLGSGLGLDSLDALELILGVEQLFGVRLDESNVDALRSINTLVDHILAQATGGQAWN